MAIGVPESFRQQAGWCRALGSPFTARLMEVLEAQLSADDPVMARVRGWTGDPAVDALPLRLAGGLHALVLTGADPDLAAIYPPDAAPDDTILAAGVAAAIRRHSDHLLDWLTRVPQTNEVARSAMLLLGLAELHRRTGLPLSVREIGASAGLNLHWDRFSYRFGDVAWGPASGVRIAPEWLGDAPDLPAAVPVADRAAADLHPLDPGNPRDRLTLRAYVWPDQRERLERLDAAIEIAAASPVRVERIDAASFAEREFAAPVPGAVRVLVHTILWQYLPDTARGRIRRCLEAAGARATAEAPIAHVAFETILDALGARPGLSMTIWPGGETVTLAGADAHVRRIRWGAALESS
jgi:hypothetical protein